MDNNSTDRTRAVVEDSCRRHPGRFRYVFEPHPGKSYALNTGLQEARGEIVAFIDDDVKVEPTWLHNLTAVLHNGDWAGAGGRTLPERPFPPPRWLDLGAPHALAPLAVFDRGLDARELTETPFGNNMAYRREMFRKYGGFRIDLGPRAGSRVPQKCEDVEFGQRLLTAGERLRYEPSAIVYHAVPDCRVQKTYFLAWWFDKARADIDAFGIPRRQVARRRSPTRYDSQACSVDATMGGSHRFRSAICLQNERLVECRNYSAVLPPITRRKETGRTRPVNMRVMLQMVIRAELPFSPALIAHGIIRRGEHPSYLSASPICVRAFFTSKFLSVNHARD